MPDRRPRRLHHRRPSPSGPGRRRQRHVAGAGAVAVDHLRDPVGRREPDAWRPGRGRRSSTAATATPRCRSSRTRRRSSKAPRRRWRSARAWARSPRSCSALCSHRRPHRRPAPDVLGRRRRSSRWSCPRFGIDVTFVDGTDADAIAAAVQPGQDDARLRRDAGQPPARPRRPRRGRRDHRAVHGGRLDVRHADRAAAARPRRRPRAALGHQGHRRPQRRHARRRRRRRAT